MQREMEGGVFIMHHTRMYPASRVATRPIELVTGELYQSIRPVQGGMYVYMFRRVNICMNVIVRCYVLLF